MNNAQSYINLKNKGKYWRRIVSCILEIFVKSISKFVILEILYSTARKLTIYYNIKALKIVFKHVKAAIRNFEIRLSDQDEVILYCNLHFTANFLMTVVV